MLRIPQSYVDELLEGDWMLHDPTSEGMGLSNSYATVTARPKERGVVAGLEIAARLFETVGATVRRIQRDGDYAMAGQPILRATGRSDAIHAVYKTAQCVMEYATGIARRTRLMVEQANDVSTRIRVAGTRKHYPGGKFLAVTGFLAGGGILHRAGLSDSLLVFDQHRLLVSDPEAAVKALMRAEPEKKVAVEVATPEEGMRWAGLGVHIIQCERFDVETFAAFAAQLHAKHPGVVINAAGGINASNARAYAEAGADVLVTSWPYFGAPADVKMDFFRERRVR